jgi:hypothetical protein
MEIEERSEKKEPSPAAIALKPKDCADMWSDAKQKMFFRFHCFFGQDFACDGWKSRVQVPPPPCSPLQNRIHAVISAVPECPWSSAGAKLCCC